ncbi:MAG: hypothetical protein ABSE89_11165 [Sedimentisphaerales bacterium]
MENYFDFKKIRQYLKNPKIKVFVAVFLIFLFLYWVTGLFKIPSNFRPVRPITDGNMSQYLTNYILPQLYNKLQLNQPFELVISEAGVNDIIVRHIDANTLQRANLSDLSVTLKKRRILLTAKTVYYGFDFIMTLVLKPYIDKNGYFSLKESQIEAGESRIPFAGEAVKKKIIEGLAGFFNNLNVSDFNETSFDVKIEPVFSLNHQKHRIDKITVQNKELIIHFLSQ